MQNQAEPPAENVLRELKDIFSMLSAVQKETRQNALEEAADLIQRRAVERHGYDKHGDAAALRALAG